jgi:hypothetical protein
MSTSHKALFLKEAKKMAKSRGLPAEVFLSMCTEIMEEICKYGPDSFAHSLEREKRILEEAEDGYRIVKAILGEVIDPKRVFVRHCVAFSSIVLDNSRLKLVCRIHSSSAKTKDFETLDMEKRISTRHKIASMHDIAQYADTLKAAVVAIEARYKRMVG